MVEELKFNTISSCTMDAIAIKQTKFQSTHLQNSDNPRERTALVEIINVSSWWNGNC